jgi:hypothetical protein
LDTGTYRTVTLMPKGKTRKTSRRYFRNSEVSFDTGKQTQVTQ